LLLIKDIYSKEGHNCYSCLTIVFAKSDTVVIKSQMKGHKTAALVFYKRILIFRRIHPMYKCWV